MGKPNATLSVIDKTMAVDMYAQNSLNIVLMKPDARTKV